ncbi:MAG: hypothetical protein U1C74_34090 [Phenylobacterium sp.]|nr:hypothetical protein [Phenylobacterium sp.]
MIGPVDRAGMALALAAQTPVDLALVDRRLAGHRDGPAFAEALMTTWGARSILIDDGVAHDAPANETGPPAWLAQCDVAARVRAILAGLDPPRAEAEPAAA